MEAEERRVSLQPREGHFGLFGGHTITKDAKEVGGFARYKSTTILTIHFIGASN